MPDCTRRAMWRACVQLALVPAALSCRSWCGKWACPFDFCNDCFDRCAYKGLQSGTPKAHPLSNLVDSGEQRQPPDVKKSGARLPRFESPDWSLERDGVADRTAVDVTFELSLPKADAHRFTPYFLGTNVPLYSPYHEMKKFHAPVLVAAGIRVWRWPGGAASNFWCPSFEDEAWDACFDEFPIFKAPDLPQGLPAYPTNKELLHLSNFIDLCKESGVLINVWHVDCIPLFTINSGIALRYGIEKCVQYVAKVVRAFDKAGVPLKHFEFGNEMFGWWAAPYGYDDPSDGARDFMWDPADYGKAFTSVRTRLLEMFPNHPMSFGLVVNDDQEARCQGSHICYWNERILDDSNAGKDADWLSFHRYFSDYNKEWVHDHRILWSAGPMLDAVSRTVSGYWNRRNLPTKPIAITEYNSAFRQTPACGASQQFISLLWQTKFFGQTILRNEFQMLNHFSARAVPVKCTGKSDFAAYQVDGVRARAPTNTYSIITPSFAPKNIPATPTPAYFAFWLWNRYMGEEVIQSTFDKGLAVFVSRFQDFPGEVGLILVNMDPGGRRVSIPGASLGVSAGDSVSLNAHVIQAGGDGGYPEADAWQKQNRLFDLTVLVNGEPMDTTNTYGGGPSMIEHIQPYWDYFVLKGTDTIDFDLPKQAVMGVLLSRTRFPPVVPPSSPPSPEPSPPPPAPPHEERLKISPLGVWMSSHVNKTEWDAKADYYKWADHCCAAGSKRSKCCPSSTYPSAERCIDGITGNSQGWNFCLNSFTDKSSYPWLSVQVPCDSKIGDVWLAPREDCCEEELYPFEIWIGDVLGAGGDPYATNATRCGPRYHNKTLQVSCGGLQGSYVTLRLPGAGRTLMLSEITIYNVFGPLKSPATSPRESAPPRLPAPPPPPTPPPPTPPQPPPPGPPRTSNKLARLRASMSSTLTYRGTEYHAANCIDGKKTGQNFCMSQILPKQNHPNPAWLSIEVPENSKIGDVLIFNRIDCCQRFLSPFEVWVSNAPGVPGPETNAARRCGGVNVVPAEVGPFSVSCQGLVGSQVTILLPGDERVIDLAEVEIYSASNEPTRLPVRDSADDSSPNAVPRSPNVVSNSQGTEGPSTMAYIVVAVGLLLGAALGIVRRNRCWCFPRQHIRVVADEAKEGRSKKAYDRKVASCSEIALESAESRRQPGD